MHNGPGVRVRLKEAAGFGYPAAALPAAWRGRPVDSRACKGRHTVYWLKTAPGASAMRPAGFFWLYTRRVSESARRSVPVS